MLLFTAKEALMYHCILPESSIFRINGKPRVARRYIITFPNFLQLSVFDCFTHVHRTNNAVCMSGLVCFDRYKSFAVR